MEERNIELDIRRWLDLSKSGKAKEAKDFYYENHCCPDKIPDA